MGKRGIAAAVAGMCLTGCANFPIEAVDQVSLAAVEERVKCEIGEAYRILRADERYPDLSRWAAGLALTLSVDSTGGIVTSSSLTGPFGSISPLELNAGASLNAKRTALLNVYVAFIEAARHPCPPASPILIEGHLGLGQWIVRVFESQYLVNQNSTLQSGFDGEKSIGYNIEFLLTLTAGATPNFLIANATGTKAAFSLEAKSTHSVDIAMVELSPADFAKRFREVRIPGRVIDIENPALKDMSPEMLRESNIPKTIKKRLPDRVVREPDGVAVKVGVLTRLKLDGILQQLNNKLLIQSLRR
ncbi:hypothetical protein HAP48_0011085 [Bradyrhizobium septentrionale]|uniref:Uncharacterized protein n=1 Tax=Bradyrhizobium septentrionale TaxID=1404411 RepID=A0A973W8K8_9BRAD|nr:hypothetical protein [Bradyrhizobium septentrionale]UGY17919.1 hypothetical protein HAP48_0011085 [Bradyrhizobium septentrionale]